MFYINIRASNFSSANNFKSIKNLTVLVTLIMLNFNNTEFY